MALSVLLLVKVAAAEAPVSVEYIYDDRGQLAKVVDSTGTVLEYVYDPAGNIAEIKRATVAGLAIVGFSPQKGPVGVSVRIQGQGFSASALDDVVAFNGTPAAVVGATTNVLVAVVPVGATTGPIAVSVGGASASSDVDFTVLNTPVVTDVDPNVAIAGTTLAVHVSGANLLGASFDFAPSFSPPALTVSSATVGADGTTADLTVSVAADAASANTTPSFVLVARNAGSSSAVPTTANSVTILNSATADTDGDGLSNSDEIARGTNPLNPDTDGDGFGDGEEVQAGSNPRDQNSTPRANGFVLREAVGAVVAALNSVDPSGPAIGEAGGGVVSVLNGVDPSAVVMEADGPVVSVENQ